MHPFLIAVLVLAGFAVGVIFSSLVRVFIDKQIHALHLRANAIEESAKAEGDRLRARVVELERKIAGKF